MATLAKQIELTRVRRNALIMEGKKIQDAIRNANMEIGFLIERLEIETKAIKEKRPQDRQSPTYIRDQGEGAR